MHANALVVMAKAPVAGQSKTRLVPPLSYEEAAELSLCLLLDLLETLKSFEEADRFIAFSPAGSASFFRKSVSTEFGCFPQRGRDLGERMKNVFDDLMKRGYRNVVLVGSDVPALSPGWVDEAFSTLRKSDRVILGPTRDGGYYLIGLNRPVPDIFNGIAWSSSGVLASTTQKLMDLGIDLHLLPSWFDIDTFNDLCHLQSLAVGTLKASRRRTVDFVQGLALNKRPAPAT